MFFVFDAFLRDKRGHFFNLDLALKNLATSRGERFKVYGFHKGAHGADLTQLAPEKFFFFHPATPHIDQWEVERDVFYCQLRGIRHEAFEKNDTLFFHSLNFACLLGAASWLESLDPNPRLNIRFFLSFDDFIDYPSRRFNAISEHYRDFYKRLGALNHDVRILTESSLFQLWNSRLANGYVPVFQCPFIKPINMLLAERSRRICESDPTPRVGFFGYAKKTKGTHLIPEIIEAVEARASGAARFYVHASGVPEGEDWSALRNLVSSETLQFEHTDLDTGSYYHALAQCDLIVLPYGEVYTTHSSAIFYEALAIGVPCIVPSLSTMQEEITNLKLPLLGFESQDPEPIADAIADAIPRLGSVSRAYREAGAELLSRASADCFV